MLPGRTIITTDASLKEIKKIVRNKAIDEFAERFNQKITDFILEHQDQLDFVSGVGMGWRFVEEVAEAMKGERYRAID